ncbi:site-specific integrase [Maridesulfovibrio ferrireducens]|uniref:tyrosine-type recombinase/integrase n=1 Tax=Maridesulfovibrio ferrireducens TaxID=246191 RepID=UPI001A33EC9C|nr:site-specific integrase [Maridesulfovibrio ferrireducens]MBI9113358.1 site-specific integrase [Maridesulfovibrio ferrireducens]
MTKYIGTKFTGVRYREHPTRRHGPHHDKYFIIRYKVGGKAKQEALGWASQGWSAAKAHKLRCDLVANIKLGKGSQTLEESRQVKAAKREAEKNFEQAGNHYIESYAKKNKKSWKHDETRFKMHLLPILGKIFMDNLTIGDIEDLKNSCVEKGLAKATVGQCLALTRQICNYSIQYGWMSINNPVRGVKFPKLNNQRLRYCTPEEEQEFFTLAQERNYTEVHDICYLSLYTGMRMGELFVLTKQDIDFAAGTILIKGVDAEDDGPKSGKSRVAYISDKLRNMLMVRVGQLDKPNSLLFPAADDGIKKEVGHNFKTLMKYLGWNDGVNDRRLRFCAHCFRHSFASRLIANGTPVPVVQKLMGHATIQTTMRYVHTNDSQCRAAIDLL